MDRPLHSEAVTAITPTTSTDGKDNTASLGGQTITVRTWRIPQTSHGEEQAEKNSAASICSDVAKYSSEWTSLISLYRVMPAEWTASEARWRNFVAGRSNDTAPALDAGRLHVPSSSTKPDWQVRGEGEERFSKVLTAAHEKCTVCTTVREVEADVALSEDERAARLAGLAHEVPKLRLRSTGNLQALVPRSERSGASEEALLVIGEQSRRDACLTREVTAERGERWRCGLPTFDVTGLEVKRGWDDRGATGALLKSGNETSLLGEVIANPALVERARVFQDNKAMVKRVIDEADTLHCLSTAEKETYSTVAAEAWELERDLVRLEKMQQAIKARVHSAEAGYSVNHYNAKRCSDRRKSWEDTGSHPVRYGSLGLHRKTDTESDVEESESEIEEAVTTEKESGHAVDPFQQRIELASSPTPLALTIASLRNGVVQVAQSVAVPNPDYGQRDRGFASIRDDPLHRVVVGAYLPSIQGSTRPGNGREATTTTAEKANKVDSIVDEEYLIDEVEMHSENPAAHEGRGPRRLPITHSSHTRPRWRS
ncbi:hypothetical protein E8E13_000285 [Curvularia kusanoi]|uniref:Uncharacterized protein n=1 Tax=Curvularia kusanoi TaxID=90978 RepID=A0A9P4T436_CURKU|nr:hypothetical protein E8E13_000285 [Curvularia kusanoi]